MSTAEYTCNDGYEIVEGDVKVNLCKEDKNWQSKPPTCHKVKCPVPQTLENGIIISDEQTEYNFEDSVKYGCNVGYKMQGGRFIRCLADRTWSQMPVCSLIECSPLPAG